LRKARIRFDTSGGIPTYFGAAITKKYKPTERSRYVEKRSDVIYNIMVKRGIVKEEYDQNE
jgi:hypothetical protein